LAFLKVRELGLDVDSHVGVKYERWMIFKVTSNYYILHAQFDHVWLPSSLVSSPGTNITLTSMPFDTDTLQTDFFHVD
jgi:hypothetical protein